MVFKFTFCKNPRLDAQVEHEQHRHWLNLLFQLELGLLTLETITLPLINLLEHRYEFQNLYQHDKCSHKAYQMM